MWAKWRGIYKETPILIHETPVIYVIDGMRVNETIENTTTELMLLKPSRPNTTSTSFGSF